MESSFDNNNEVFICLSHRVEIVERIMKKSVSTVMTPRVTLR